MPFGGRSHRKSQPKSKRRPVGPSLQICWQVFEARISRYRNLHYCLQTDNGIEGCRWLIKMGNEQSEFKNPVDWSLNIIREAEGARPNGQSLEPRLNEERESGVRSGRGDAHEREPGAQRSEAKGMNEPSEQRNRFGSESENERGDDR